MRRPLVHAVALAGALLDPGDSSALEFRAQQLALRGAPATLFTADVDRDGRSDLVAVLASSDWGEVATEEPQGVDDAGVYVDVLTVVPMLFDRRTLTVHLGQGGGGFAPEPLALELPESVHALLPGPKLAPLLAWTDDGVASVEIVDGALSLVARIAARAVVAGGSGFLAELGLTPDLDGDGERDLLLPASDGLRVHLSPGGALAAEPSDRVPYPLEERLPGDARHYRDGTRRFVPLPVAADLDGDRQLELLFREYDRGWNRTRIARNLSGKGGGGRFAPAIDPLAGRARDAEPGVVWIGDLEGDGRAELVTREELTKEDASMREELAEARSPRARYRVHALGDDLAWNPEPKRTFELVGHLFGGVDDADVQLGIPDAIADLDGDGRVDLVGLELDFSVVQVLRVMTARSISLGLDFRPYCQKSDGSFLAPPSQDLGGKFTLRLERLRLGQLSSFAGDFDGDRRADFLQLGRGKSVSVRFGKPGCLFPEAGAAKIELAREPANLALVRVLDLDGDGRSDLAVTNPPERGALGGRGVLDLYFSTGDPR